MRGRDAPCKQTVFPARSRFVLLLTSIGSAVCPHWLSALAVLCATVFVVARIPE